MKLTLSRNFLMKFRGVQLRLDVVVRSWHKRERITVSTVNRSNPVIIITLEVFCEVSFMAHTAELYEWLARIEHGIFSDTIIWEFNEALLWRRLKFLQSKAWMPFRSICPWGLNMKAGQPILPSWFGYLNSVSEDTVCILWNFR